MLGAERKLFFFALVIGAAVFNLLHTFLGGLFMFALLYSFARWATKTDPQVLRLLLNSAKTRAQYDPMKFAPIRFGGCVMFRLAHALKHSREAGSLNERINLFGFIDDHTFLTKSGDVGVVLAIRGVDYECLDANGIDNCTKRLESAFKTLDDRCRIYQYLFKRNAPDLPHQTYPNPVVSAAIENRIAYLEGKADSLYALDIYFVVLFEASRAKEAVLRTFSTGVARKPRMERAGSVSVDPEAGSTTARRHS